MFFIYHFLQMISIRIWSKHARFVRTCYTKPALKHIQPIAIRRQGAFLHCPRMATIVLGIVKYVGILNTPFYSLAGKLLRSSILN